MDYFYKTLKRDGCYVKPNGYKSHEEKLSDEAAAAAAAAEEMRILKKLKDTRLEKAKYEKQIVFEKILADPDGKDWARVFAALDDYSQGRYKNSKKHHSRAFENAMRRPFEKLYNEGEL